jgi:hypothetical protein
MEDPLAFQAFHCFVCVLPSIYSILCPVVPEEVRNRVRESLLEKENDNLLINEAQNRIPYINHGHPAHVRPR